jgi:hypothetical protein
VTENGRDFNVFQRWAAGVVASHGAPPPTLREPLVIAIGAVVGALETLQVDPQDINDVVRMLESAATDIEAQPVTGVPGNRFGGSSLGSSLGHHTDLAHTKLAEAMSTMVTNLRGVSQDVRQHEQRMVSTDQGIQERAVVLTQGMECIAEDGFATPDACVPAGGDR